MMVEGRRRRGVAEVGTGAGKEGIGDILTGTKGVIGGIGRGIGHDIGLEIELGKGIRIGEKDHGAMTGGEMTRGHRDG